MTPKEVWESFCVVRPEFEGFQYDKFPSRLRALRKRIQDDSQRSNLENAAFLRDRELFPVSTVTNRKLPRWEGSLAERYLKADVTAKLHERMKPEDLQKTRPVYLVFGSEDSESISTRKSV